MRERDLSLRRLSAPGSVLAVVLLVVAAVAETLGTVLTGRFAEHPDAAVLGVLALAWVGASALDTVGRTAFSGVVGRAEGTLRRDLLRAAYAQPLPALAEQAVGEVIDRVDDDPRELAYLLRGTGWDLARAVIRSALAWVVAGITWWPAWVAFPVVTVIALLLARPLTPVIAARKEQEEARWSEHAAALEEVVAGRDDVRSSLGQAHVVRRYAGQASSVLDAVRATSDASSAVAWRTGVALSALLVALAVAGVLLVGSGQLSVGALITLWLLIGGFVGDLTEVSNRLPEVQAGLGALARIRSLLAVTPEQSAGAAVPQGPLELRLVNLSFGYAGGFSLRDISFRVPAGTTCAIVGRSGAGKSTLAALFSRAVEPPEGAVLLGGEDVRSLRLAELRRCVGVVTQRTEVLAATLLQNITLFADVSPRAVDEAIASLGLTDWVADLPAGLETQLGPGGLTLSAGEEQLVAFARLLVRDVGVVILDEATARMDPVTEARVTAAADALLSGRTGLLIAHRLSTTRRAQSVAVLDRGRLLQFGPRADLADRPGPFRDLLAVAGDVPVAVGVPGAGLPRQRREPVRIPPVRPGLARTVARAVLVRPRWGIAGALLFMATAVFGAYGVISGWFWGRLVQDLSLRGPQPDGGLGAGEDVWGTVVGLSLTLLIVPFALAWAFRIYPAWWVLLTLQLRLSVLRGQVRPHRLARTPPGEVAARCLDSDRLINYVDRWVDVVMGLLVVAITGICAGSFAAAGLIASVMGVSAAVSAAGAPVAGSAAERAGNARAEFGRTLGSAVDAARTVKLASATSAVLAHLDAVDADRVAASVREFRIRALLEGVPGLLVQFALIACWAAHLAGWWNLATTLLVATAVAGSTYFGTVAGAAVTEAPSAREWLRAVAELAGTPDLLSVPADVDLVTGDAPAPEATEKISLRTLNLQNVTAVHDDGTVGVSDVDLTVGAGELVLLTGRVGSGKSSLLAALAGLLDHDGSIRWNGTDVADPQVFLRPGQVAYVGQLPRVLSGSFHDNVDLDHAHSDRRLHAAFADARLRADLTDAGGSSALVGHRGIRLSGGQVQRLALARALASGADLLVADDVSSALDARTEVELWDALRSRGVTVVGSSAKRSALLRADRVVVLEDGRVAATGRWQELEPAWGHLAG